MGCEGVRAAVGATGESIGGTVVVLVDAASAASASSACKRAWNRWLRTDWWAMAVRMSRVDPTTSVNTPMSKNKALAMYTSPTHGQ